MTTDKTPTRLPHGPAAALRDAARRAGIADTVKTHSEPTDLLVRRYNGKLKRLLEAVDKVLFSRHGAPPTETYFGCDCADCNTLQQARAAFGKED